MTTNLPDLSTWNRVPVGATIPKGTPYAYAYGNSVNVRFNGPPEDFTVRDNSYYPHYTEHPIGLPLPTEEGATILASSQLGLCGIPPHILLTLDAGLWVNCYGFEWSADQIASWAPVTIGETVVIR